MKDGSPSIWEAAGRHRGPIVPSQTKKYGGLQAPGLVLELSRCGDYTHAGRRRPACAYGSITQWARPLGEFSNGVHFLADTVQVIQTFPWQIEIFSSEMAVACG